MSNFRQFRMWQYMATCGNTFSVPFEILTVYAKNSLPNPAPRFRDKFLEIECNFRKVSMPWWCRCGSGSLKFEVSWSKSRLVRKVPNYITEDPSHQRIQTQHTIYSNLRRIANHLPHTYEKYIWWVETVEPVVLHALHAAQYFFTGPK
jgi:hypothetical protein